MEPANGTRRGIVLTGPTLLGIVTILISLGLATAGVIVSYTWGEANDREMAAHNDRQDEMVERMQQQMDRMREQIEAGEDRTDWLCSSRQRDDMESDRPNAGTCPPRHGR